MKKNQVILFYGAPASGKYTMAKRLSDENGFLLDNHFFHDMFENLIEITDERQKIEYFDQISMMKTVFLDIIKHFYPQKNFVRYIFTSCIGNEVDRIIKLKDFAEDLRADFIPIELKADLEVLKTRCQTEYRESRKKISDPEKLESVIKRAFIKSPDFEHENKLLIDNSFLSEDETFEKIKKHLKQFE